MIGSFFVAGMNHLTAPVDVREQLALEEEKVREILTDLWGRGLFSEVMILSTKTEDEAVHHVFRVAASLDSMLVGEPQILGQVKEAFALAQSSSTIGPLLHALMSRAFGVAKRV